MVFIYNKQEQEIPQIFFFDEIDGLAVVQEYSNNVNKTQPIFVKFYH